MWRDVIGGLRSVLAMFAAGFFTGFLLGAFLGLALVLLRWATS